MLAEVTNTPWGERHSYLLWTATPGSAVRGDASPSSCTSRRSWAWITSTGRAPRKPGATLSVHIESHRDGTAAFDATLAMRPSPLTRGAVARMTARYPLATARVLALIYGHALGLKLPGARVHPHPEAADPMSRAPSGAWRAVASRCWRRSASAA